MRTCFSLLFFLLVVHTQAQVLRKRTTLLMGGRFDIIIVAADSLSAERNIDTCIKEISRIEYLISDWKPQSQVSEVNQYAGIRPVKVDREVFDLTRRAIRLSQETEGAFDISFAAMEKVWKFDGSMMVMPSAEAIRRSIAKVGYCNIILDSLHSTIFLKLKGMKVGFGALGEGYAGDRCREMMLRKGIKAGIIDASGDLTAWGKQPDGSRWNIGVTNPLHPDIIFNVVSLRESAMVTSGSYQKFVMLQGRRYAHIINPKTGYPATGLISVSITGPSAERANGFSTSMMVLGLQKGLEFVKKYPAYHYIIITDAGRIVASRNFNIKKRQL